MEILFYILLGLAAAVILFFLFKILMVGLAVWGIYKTAKYVEREAKDIPEEGKIIHAQIQEGNIVRPVAKFAWRRFWRFWDVR